MVFHWILRESKSPQVSRTLLLILADLNNAIFWMVSIRPPFSNPSNLLSRSLGISSKCTNYNWYHRHLRVLQLFLVLWQSRSTGLSFCFLRSSLCGRLERQSPLYGRVCLSVCLFLFVYYYEVWFLAWIKWFVWNREFYAFHYLGRILGWAYYFTPWEFFTALADGLGFKWQQVSSSLQDSSLYSGRSQ